MAVGLAGVSFLRAQTANWTGNTSADWATAANWDTNTVPASNNTTVVIDANSGNLPVYSTGAATVGNITVGNTSASGANTTLTIESGGNLTGGVLYVGKAAGANGAVLITGNGTVFTANKTDSSVVGVGDTANIEVGTNGTGSLSITNGAHVIGRTFVGIRAGSTGTLMVAGDGTRLDSPTHLYVGQNGTANATFSDGATFTALDIFVGGTGNALTATGQAVSGNHTTLNLGDRLLIQGANDTATIANGAQLTANQGLTMTGNGASLLITDNGTSFTTLTDIPSLAQGFFVLGSLSGDHVQLTVANGAVLTSNLVADGHKIGAAANATGCVTVTGPGSTWNATGNLVVGGNGTGSLTIANGGMVSVTNGALILGQNATGNGTLNLYSNGVLQVAALNQNIAISQNAGIASGQGQFNWEGGIVRIITNGALVFNATLIGDGAVVDTSGHTATLGGVLSGSGNFTKNGAGNLSLLPCSYTGTTTINAGTLTLQALNATMLGNVVDNAALFVQQTNDTAYAGVISGNGTLTVLGALTLSGNNNSLNGNITLGSNSGQGTLNLTGNTTSLGGNIVITGGSVATNGRVIFTQDFDSSFVGKFSNYITIVKTGSGNLTLSADHVLSSNVNFSSVLIDDGSIIFTGDTSQNTNLHFFNSGNIVFSQAFDSSFQGYIQGGNIIQAGSGTLNWTAGFFSSGANLTIVSGTLVAASGGTGGNTTNNGTLVFSPNVTATFSSPIAGTGAVIQNGTATMNLIGNCTYTGPTTINSGTLMVDGNLTATSSVTVNAGGTLGGVATITAPVSVNAGGGLAPGDSSNGTLSVSSLTLASGSAVTFYVNDAGNHTNLAIGGALSLGGNLTLNLGDSLHAGVYNLFSSGNTTGDFDGVAFGGFLSGTLTDSGGVWGGSASGVNFSLDIATGQLTVSTTFPPGTSPAKQTWLQNNFSIPQLQDTSVSGDSANPSGDGISNLEKYAFNLNVWTDGHASLPQPVVSGGNLVLAFAAPPADVSWTVEASEDLTTWTTSNVTVQTSGNTVTASYPLPPSGRAFMHVLVAPAP
ncbi:MAG TPA: autotransporter-associated beta strand repeat-containing protein [Opitutales bacterium]|nr:autotransporter-associated beta strand repeat-containing protein [Opitutales bacterium]